jgi:hypothetical protein
LKILDEKRIKKFPKVGVTFLQWKMRHKEMQKELTPLPGTIFSRIFLKSPQAWVTKWWGQPVAGASFVQPPPNPPSRGST